MASATADDDSHGVAIGGKGPGANADLAGPSRWVDVQGENRVDAVHGAGGDHLPRAGGRFLRGLQDGSPRQRPRGDASLFKSLERDRGHGDNRRMSIMATGMHDAVSLTAKGDGLFILNLQRVDVAANGDPRRSGWRRIVGYNTAAIRAHPNFESRFQQPLIEVQARVELGAARFWWACR